jgi:hypothetical protein
MRRRWWKMPKGTGRHFAYAMLSTAEYAVVKGQAARAGLSVSDYVRRCINSMLLEEGDDDIPLLEERRKSRQEAEAGAYE